MALDRQPTIAILGNDVGGERMPTKPLTLKNQPNNFPSADLKGVIRYIIKETGQLIVERRGRLSEPMWNFGLASLPELRMKRTPG